MPQTEKFFQARMGRAHRQTLQEQDLPFFSHQKKRHPKYLKLSWEAQEKQILLDSSKAREHRPLR
ncbi:hypothetical protein LEMLEM_LOCUS1817 [Lemmus lemmus]